MALIISSASCIESKRMQWLSSKDIDYGIAGLFYDTISVYCSSDPKVFCGHELALGKIVTEEIRFVPV
jgi:hypothetical protein